MEIPGATEDATQHTWQLLCALQLQHRLLFASVAPRVRSMHTSAVFKCLALVVEERDGEDRSGCTPLRCLNGRGRLSVMDGNHAGRLELGKMEAEFVLHPSEGSCGQAVASDMLGVDGGKLGNARFGRRLGACRATTWRKAEVKATATSKDLQNIRRFHLNLLSSKVNIKPSLQKFISHQGHTKLRGGAAHASCREDEDSFFFFNSQRTKVPPFCFSFKNTHLQRLSTKPGSLPPS